MPAATRDHSGASDDERWRVDCVAYSGVEHESQGLHTRLPHHRGNEPVVEGKEPSKRAMLAVMEATPGRGAVGGSSSFCNCMRTFRRSRGKQSASAAQQADEAHARCTESRACCSRRLGRSLAPQLGSHRRCQWPFRGWAADTSPAAPARTTILGKVTGKALRLYLLYRFIVESSLIVDTGTV